jgi:predicted O-linked N-acetylglucosamine transferase (SPINDLY family)
MSDIIIAGLLPVIYQSQEDLEFWRGEIERKMRKLAADGVKMDVTRSFAVPEFMATYQGYNDRELQTIRANLYTAPQNPDFLLKRPIATPGQAPPKIRVALISAHFKNHTIGRLMMGLVAKLPRDNFHVTVLLLNKPQDDVAQFFLDHADTCAILPPDLARMRAVMTSGKFDVLYYADLGMEPVTYTLALSRLAPVQCVTWGHPVTSGMKTVDYFISAEGLEPENSENQYTEKLVKLRDLAVYYYRPKLEGSPVGPEHFGLPDGANLYGCPQSLYKLHPQFDAIIAGILRKDPDGLLLLLSAHFKEWEEKLLARFQQTIPDVVERIRFIPRQKREGFLQLNALCDVLLDPLHFGGGNTTYEALALGTPVVTLPSQFLRGRLACKMYQTMGMMDCVANSPKEYIEIATRLGLDAQFHKATRQKILDTCGILFENMNGIRQLADFWKKVVPRK